MPGIEVSLDGQIEALRRVCAPFRQEYVGYARYKTAVAQQFGPGFGYIEAQLLHAVVRSYRPRRIVEVGSGVSTCCALAAVEMNARDDGRQAHVTAIEPHPSAALRSLAVS